ncbi:MAG: flagellar basal body L-ring protein FlgH [Gammaproteobacteria bacterium]|nr:flagellar basal body L-ring protein FlgH [Gammaproteobacteria bacterium]
MHIKSKLRIVNTLILLSSLVLLQACSTTRVQVQPDPMFAPIDLKQSRYQPVNNGAIFQQGRSVRLFEDSKAFRVGDLLSVSLSESTNATKSAATKTTKDDEFSIGGGTFFGVTPTNNGDEVLSNSLTSEREFEGSGDSAQSNSLRGVITVMVSEILPNGNMVVRGEKIIGLNQGSEFIRLTGIVRPQDVSSNNEVVSGKLANARIFYGGGGVVAEANTKGWLSRFFSSPVFPF